MNKIDENGAWFFDEDPKFYVRVHVMYDKINPDLLIFKDGTSQDLSGFRYELSHGYDTKKNNKDYLYKAGDKTVKFHKANTDDKNDKALETWYVTCHVLEVIEKNYSTIILPKVCLDKEANLLQNSSFADKVKTLIFNVRKKKNATLEYLLKWDFLPNSTGLMLVNERALKVLESVAKEDIQAFPAEIRMYDNGEVLKNYYIINITTCMDVLNREKSVLKSEEWRRPWNMYEKEYFNKNCMGDHALLKIDHTSLFLASEKVRMAVKEAKLTGLVFSDTWGGVAFIE